MRVRIALAAAFVLALAGCQDAEAPTTPVDFEEPPPVTAETTQASVKSDIADVSPSTPTRAIRIGRDGADMDACGTYAEVAGLNPDGDNFLSVRAAPSVDAAELDRLDSGQGVSVCDYADDFVGVVYPGDDSATDCGTGSPVGREQDYAGPCRSGWVAKKYLRMVAG